ncbi:hypothetical protein SDC9_59553 [bioreactor metagenome]|uniref:Uncharacterized protein n=1 Tax=bioreactor metagenome TaxID=1076179 RepID=A0A644XBQ0_9ZZZZ
MVDGAGGTHHDVVSAVLGQPVLDHGIAIHRPDTLHGPDDRLRQAAAPVQSPGGQVVGDVAGVVIAHRDLLEHDGALRGEMLGPDQRVREHVRHHPDRPVGLLGEQPGVEAGVLLGGVRVEITADPLDGGGDLLGAEPRGALEQDVLEHVRGAVQSLGLAARAHSDEEAEIECGGVGQTLGDDAQSARQGRTAQVAGQIVGRQERAVDGAEPPGQGRPPGQGAGPDRGSCP